MEETKKHYIPFDFYDFFGYIFPGFLMFTYISILAKIEKPELINTIKNYFITYEKDVIYIIIFSICLIIMIYLIGHFVATLGSFLLERIFNLGIFDLPINYLLQLDHTVRFYLVATYKYIFILVNLILLLTIFLNNYYIKIIIVFLIVILSVFIFIRIIAEGLNAFEKTRSWKNKMSIKKTIKSYLWIADNLIGPIINFIRIIVNNNKQFNEDFIDKYSTVFNKKYGIDYKKCGEENLWLTVYSVSVNSSIHFSLIRTWHHLSGFSRNISCVSYISAFIITYLLLFIDGVNYDALRYLQIFSISFAWIFFLRYLNLSQSYYVKNIIRSFVAEESTKE